MSVEHALKSSKLKVTKARLAVGTALEQAGMPLKIESLYELLPTPRPDLVTIYRVLEQFEKAGLVCQVDLRHGHTHYEWAKEHHHHLVCTECGTTQPIHEKEIEDLFEKISAKYKNDFTIRDHALEFFGICKKCAK